MRAVQGSANGQSSPSSISADPRRTSAPVPPRPGPTPIGGPTPTGVRRQIDGGHLVDLVGIEPTRPQRFGGIIGVTIGVSSRAR